MHIPFDRRSGTPLHIQIQRHLERLILRGSFPHGYKLPASRELARDLGVNRGTVTRAYRGLETEGLVHSHIGQGTFVRRPGLTPEEPPVAETGAHRTKV